MRRYLAIRWMKKYLAGELDCNTSRAAMGGYDGKYPGVWFDFSAHICPQNHLHKCGYGRTAA